MIRVREQGFCLFGLTGSHFEYDHAGEEKVQQINIMGDRLFLHILKKQRSNISKPKLVKGLCPLDGILIGTHEVAAS